MLPDINNLPATVNVQYSDPIIPNITFTATDAEGVTPTVKTYWKLATALPSSFVEGLPDALSLSYSNGNGTISGKVYEASADYTIQIKAYDGNCYGVAEFTLDVDCENDVIVTMENMETYFTANPSSGIGDVWFKAYIDENDDNAGDITKATIQFKDELSSNNIGSQVQVVSADQNLGVASYALSDYQLNNSEMTTTGGHAWLAYAVPGNSSYYCWPSQGTVDPVVVVLAMPGGDFVTGGGKYIHTQSAGQYAATAGTWMNFGFNMKWNKSGKNLQGNINIIFRTGTKIYHVKSNAINSLAVSQVNSGNLTYNIGIMTTKANLTDITDPMNPDNIGGNLNLKVVVWDATSVNGGKADKITVELTDAAGTKMLYSSYAYGITGADVLSGGNINVRNSNGIYVPPTCGAPTNVLATNLTQVSAVITWDAVTTTDVLCEVYLDGALKGSTAGNSFELLNLAPGTNYTVKVVRKCSAGDAPTEITFTTQSAPTTPSCSVSNLIAAVVDNSNKVNLSWTGNVPTGTSYKMEYKKYGSTSWTAVNPVSSPLTLSNLATSTKYEWRVTPTCSGVPVAGLPFTTGATRLKIAVIAESIEPDIIEPTLRAYPNPFTERLNIEFSSANDTQAKLEIFSITGAKLATLWDAPVRGGQLYQVEYLPKLVGSQMVLYHLTMNGQTRVGKMVYQERQ